LQYDLPYEVINVKRFEILFFYIFFVRTGDVNSGQFFILNMVKQKSPISQLIQGPCIHSRLECQE